MSVLTINNLPDELLRLISISGGPAEYCNFRRAMKRVWSYTTGREDHCIKHFLVTRVNYLGETKTTLCGKPHSMFDQPAIIRSNEMREWYQHGEVHRDNDQPAVICSDGLQQWYQCGELHRGNDLPAFIGSCGRQFWYQHGELHRGNDLPAKIWPNGIKHWYQHGKLHRENDMPAIIYDDGTQFWYKYGKVYCVNSLFTKICNGVITFVMLTLVPCLYYKYGVEYFP